MIAELFAGDFFHLYDVFIDFGNDGVIDLTAVLIEPGAGFGGDDEALGNRQTDFGHFGKVGALSAEQLTHGGVAFGEQVYEFFAHMGI